MLALCRALYPKYNIAALTNDIFTQEVYESSHGEPDVSRIENSWFVMTRCHMNVFGPWKLVPAKVDNGGLSGKGSCPHAAIREDISANLHVLEDLQRLFKTQILLIESGGDNLAANYSRELADYIIYVVILPIHHSPSTQYSSD